MVLVDHGRLRGRAPALAGRPVAGLDRLGPPVHALGQLGALGRPPSRSRPTSIASGAARAWPAVRGSRWASRGGAGTAAWCSSTTARGWWLPYRLAPDQLAGRALAPRPLVDVEAEFHGPDWVLGQRTMPSRLTVGGRPHGRRRSRPPWSAPPPARRAGCRRLDDRRASTNRV